MWQYCFYFMFWFFGHEACGILAPRLGIEPTLPALEGEISTTGPPGKSLTISFLDVWQRWLTVRWGRRTELLVWSPGVFTRPCRRLEGKLEPSSLSLSCFPLSVGWAGWPSRCFTAPTFCGSNPSFSPRAVPPSRLGQQCSQLAENCNENPKLPLGIGTWNKTDQIQLPFMICFQPFHKSYIIFPWHFPRQSLYPVILLEHLCLPPFPKISASYFNSCLRESSGFIVKSLC